MSENTTIHENFDILTVRIMFKTNGNMNIKKERRYDRMRQYIHYIFILACLIATFFLYNKQLAAIPLLLLSIVLFYVAYKKATNLKNKK